MRLYGKTAILLYFYFYLFFLERQESFKGSEVFKGKLV